jgi:N-acetylglucosamine-6-phosphate deacetylase
VGTDDRQFMLQGRQITLHENRLTGPDGTLAGAHLTMIEALRNAIGLLGISELAHRSLFVVRRRPLSDLGFQTAFVSAISSADIGLLAAIFRGGRLFDSSE